MCKKSLRMAVVILSHVACGGLVARDWPELIEELLGLPAPAADWRPYCPHRDAPPPDDAPADVLAAWWSENHDREPGDAVRERVLEAVKDDPGDLPLFLDLLPATGEARSIIQEIHASHGSRFGESWRAAASEWLEGFVDPSSDGGEEDPGKEGRTTLSEDERRALQRVAGNRDEPPPARDNAVQALMRTDWPGRDEWFLGLFGDESLGQSVEGHYLFQSLAAGVEADPDRLIPKVASLVGNENRVVHDNAVSCLVQFHIEKARIDALRPLVPWLEDPSWSSADDRLRLVQTLDRVKIPESVPGLISVLRRERFHAREAAASALAFHADRMAIPALREVLAEEKDERQRRLLLEALDACGGIDAAEREAALEAYARQLSTEDRREEWNTARFSHGRGPSIDPKVSLGALLEDGRRLDEAMAERLYGRVDALRDTEPDVSRSLRRVLASWPRAIVARRIIEELRGGPPEVEIVTAALRQRETIAGHAPDLLRELTAAGGYPGGVAAVLLGDAGISARILAGGDREAAAGLLASARLVRVPLPVQAVARLLQSGGPLLVRAAESYLVAEDSSAAREIVLSRHPGEMIILGARSDHDPGHFSFDHLDDSSRHLVTTMRRKDGPDEIIALLSAGYFGDEGQATILVKGGKAQFLLRPDGTRYRQRPLEDDEWQDLRRFMEESRIFDLPPLMTSVLDGIQYEAVRLTRDGGRRVFMNNPGDDGSAGSPYHLFVRRFKKLARAVSTPLQYDIFDAVAGARRAFSGKERALAVWGNQEAVLVLTGEGDTMTWRLLGQRKLGAEVERPAEWPDEELAAMNEAFLLHPHLNPSPWQARLGEGVVLAGLLKESRTYSPALRLFKVAGGSEVLSEGTYASPIVTPDGRWLVAARAGRGGWAQPNGVVRIRVEDREVLPVDLPAADTLDPVAWVPDRSAVLLRRETEEDGAGPGSAEFHLLDPITGATERVEGEFEPWFHARAHPLQPTGKPHEAWVALPGADETRVGRYETSSFSFTTAATYPRFPFTSDRMWVDAAGETVYVVNEGDLLALPFAP